MENRISSTLKKTAIPYRLNDNWIWYKWQDIIDGYQQGLIRSNAQLNSSDGIEYFKMNFIKEDGTYTFDGLPKTFASEDEIENYKIREGQFFINVRNSKELVGKSCVVYDVPKDILYNHMLIRIAHKAHITGSFINAYLNTGFGKKLLETCKKGTTTVIALYQKDLYELPIPIPNKELFNLIDSVYNNINRKIELNNKINKELEAMAKMLYDYWFVQFDFPNSDGKPYKSSKGEMVYENMLKMEIPKGWEVKTFSDFISNDKSGDWGKEEAVGNYRIKVECIRGADINGINGKGEVKAPVRYILKNNEHKVLKPGDLIVEISGGSPTQSTGRLAYITQEVIERFENPIICSNFCKAVALKKDNQFFYFIHSWNKAYDNGVLFGFEGKTSGIKNLLFESLVDNYKIATPIDDLLDKFESIVSRYEQKRQLNLRQNKELASLRDWLLPMLMSGQVRMEEIQEVISSKMEVEQT